MKTTLFFLFLTATASAGDVRLRLEDTPAHALKHNPGLVAARLRIDEARGRLVGAGRIANPELDVELLQNTRSPERAFAVTLMQPFPVTARLRLEKAVSRAQLSAAEAEVRDAGRKVVAEVRTAAVKWLALRAQRGLRNEQIALNREQTEIITEGIATGSSSPVDAATTGLETQQFKVDLLQIETERAMLAGELRQLLGVRPGDDLEIIGSLNNPVGLPKGKATGESRDDLEAARHTAEAARQSAGLAQAQKWQDIGAGLTALGERTEDAPDGYSNDFFLGIRFTVPLPLWNKNEGPIAEATAAAARAEKEVDALALGIRTEVEAAHAEMAALANLISAMDTDLLPMAAQVEELLSASQANGQTSRIEVLRARSRRIELSQRRVDALREYHLARVRYDAATGRNFTTGNRSSK